MCKNVLYNHCNPINKAVLYEKGRVAAGMSHIFPNEDNVCWIGYVTLLPTMPEVQKYTEKHINETVLSLDDRNKNLTNQLLSEMTFVCGHEACKTFFKVTSDILTKIRENEKCIEPEND